MIIQHTQVVSHMERAAMAYATPQLSRFGSVRDVTGGSGIPANPKTGNSREGNPGDGGGDIYRP